VTTSGERFVEVPEVLFFNRDHPTRSVRAEGDFRRRRAWWDPKARQQLLPSWRIGMEDARAVARADLPWPARLRCWATLPYWAAGDLPGLARDFVFAADPVDLMRDFFQRQIELALSLGVERILIDPGLDWILEPPTLRSRGRNTPFAGACFTGRAIGAWASSG